MSFDPAGTSWSVYRFPDDGMTGEPDGEPWEFHRGHTMISGTRWHGTYQRIPDKENTYACEIVRQTSGELQYNRFEICFVTPDLFVATKDDSLYRLGKRIHAAIDLTIVIDTASLGSAQDSTSDKPVPCGHGYAYMITDATHAEGGNGTADLRLKVRAGDRLRIWGASLSSQFQDEVFIYDFKHWKGDQVLDTQGMLSRTHDHQAMVPMPGQVSHRPPEVEIQARSFSCSQLGVVHAGTEQFYVAFMVYGPVKDAQGHREIKGYFQWDPSITATSPVTAQPVDGSSGQ